MILNLPDFEDKLIEFALKNNEIGIITDKANSNLVPTIINMLESKNHAAKLTILSPCDVACRLKTKNFPAYIVLSLECPFHSLENSFVPRKLIKRGNLIIDCVSNEDGLKNLDEDFFNDTENLKIKTNDESLFFRFSKLTNKEIESFDGELEKMDKILFLMSRINRIERIKKCGVFGIFFTSEFYASLVDKIVDFLESIGKETLVVFIRDISMERLIAIEFVEAIVIVDCPFFARFGDDVFVPVVNPFEICVCFGNWDGKYRINEFNPQMLVSTEERSINECTDLVLMKDTYDLKFEIDKALEDLAIHDGDAGGPTSYKKINLGE